MNTPGNNLCAKCGSPLIIISTTVRQSANPLYPITVTKKRCTNDACQADTEKKVAEQERQRLERAERSKRTHNTTYPKSA